MTAARVLIVEDESILAMGLRETLEDLGHIVVGITPRGEDAVRLAGELAPDLVFMDVRLAGEMDGIAAAAATRAVHRLPVIYLTAYSDEETLRRARITEPFGYLHKPCQARDIRTAIEMTLYKHAAERRLQVSEQRYAATLRSVGDAIIAVDRQGRVTFLNPVAEQLTGWTEADAQGRLVEEVLPLVREGTGEPVPNPVTEALRTTTPRHVSAATPLRTRTGGIVPIEATAAPILLPGEEPVGAVIAFRDVAERQRSEASLRVAQKFESLGVLAAGVAHDFNNLLTPILGYVSLVANQLPPESPLLDLLGRAEQAAHHAGELTQQLLAYAGLRPSTRQPVHLSSLVDGMSILLRSGRSPRVRFERLLPDGIPAVEGDPVQLGQVVLNLVVNAFEALDDKPGLVRIETYALETTIPVRGVFPAELPPGSYVVLAITDTGPGIDPVLREKMFDPFVTTKFAGRGLGLAAALGIVRGHKGTIRVTSQPGHGSTFEVILPAVAQARSGLSLELLEPARAGTVLVVADDPAMRLLLGRVLENVGMVVLATETPQRVGTQFSPQPGSIHVMILDATRSEAQTLRDLLDLRAMLPGVPLILTTGDDPTEATLRFGADAPTAALQKPFRPAHLAAMVTRAIPPADSATTPARTP